MKRIFSKVIILLLLVITVTGCEKDYKKLSYVDYNEYFSSKEEYIIIDHSSENDVEIIRDLEAGNGTIQIMYLEFSDEEEADKYIKRYFSEDAYKNKTKDNYTVIKNTDGKYFKLYKIENVIVYGISTEKKDRSQINEILKDLGY